MRKRRAGEVARADLREVNSIERAGPKRSRRRTRLRIGEAVEVQLGAYVCGWVGPEGIALEKFDHRRAPLQETQHQPLEPPVLREAAVGGKPQLPIEARLEGNGPARCPL